MGQRRTLMRKRSLLVTALVLGATVTGASANAAVAVAAEPSVAQQGPPAAPVPQYITWDEVEANNRVHERWLAQGHRRGERRVRNRRVRRRLQRMRQERALRRPHRAGEEACRRGEVG